MNDLHSRVEIDEDERSGSDSKYPEITGADGISASGDRRTMQGREGINQDTEWLFSHLK